MFFCESFTLFLRRRKVLSSLQNLIFSSNFSYIGPFIIGSLGHITELRVYIMWSFFVNYHTLIEPVRSLGEWFIGDSGRFVLFLLDASILLLFNTAALAVFDIFRFITSVFIREQWFCLAAAKYWLSLHCMEHRSSPIIYLACSVFIKGWPVLVFLVTSTITFEWFYFLRRLRLNDNSNIYWLAMLIISRWPAISWIGDA